VSGLKISRAAQILDELARKIGVAAAWAGIPLMVVLACLEPVLRWTGHAGDLPFGEASTAAFFALTMTSFGYAYAAGAHVRLDVLSRRFSPRARAAIELSGAVLIVLPLCAVVVMDGAESAWRSFQQAERWADTAWTLQWVLRAWVPAGFLLLMLASIASALRAIMTLAGK
jgi:TRAP-type mannitol/chloroaromatic compound transport system permease small subunit